MRNQIEVKIFFFSDHHEFGRNKGNTRSKPFLENINFCKSLLRGLNFEYPPLAKTSEITLLFLSIQ